MKKKIIIIAVSCVLAVGIVAAVLLPTGILARITTALKSDNYTVNNEVMMYAVRQEFNSYVNTYESYGDYYFETAGLDVNKNLKTQDSCYKGTWFEYFYEKAVQTMSSRMKLCEEAGKNNVTLSSEELNELKEKAKKISRMENGTSEKAATTYLTIKMLSEKYLDEFEAGLSLADDEIDKYYEENRELFDVVSFYNVAIEVNYGEEVPSDDNYQQFNDAAKARAEKLAEEIKTKGAEAAISAYLAEVGSEETVEDCYESSYAYETTSNFGAWAFDSERKDGDYQIFEGRYQYNLYFLVSAPHREDYTLRQAQVISVDLGETDNNANGVYQMYDEWKADKTADEFKELAKELGFSGVSVKNIFKDENLDEVNEWVYSSDRKSGDFELLNDEADLSLVRYESEGTSSFEARARQYYVERSLEELTERINKEYEVKDTRFFSIFFNI